MTPLSIANPGGEPVLGGAQMLAVARRVAITTHFEVGAQLAAGRDDIAEHPAEKIDRMAAERSDPAAAPVFVVEPAIGHLAPIGEQRRPRPVQRRPDRTGIEQLLCLHMGRMAAEFEVEEVEHAGLGREVQHLAGFGRTAAERFVAQHMAAGRGGEPHVLEMEKWR